VRTDEVKEFGERTCAKGGLGRIRGIDLMSTIMSLLEKPKNLELGGAFQFSVAYYLCASFQT